MIYETIELPFDEAVMLEAEQNMQRDMLVVGEHLGDFEEYKEEAEYLMREFKEGWIPEQEGHKLVKVQSCV